MSFNETIGLDFEFNTDNLQRGVNEAKSYLSALRKEQKANTSAYGEWQKSIKGVETYLQYQNKALEVNEKRVNALAAALEKEKAKTNASRVEIQRITNLLNDAKIAYNQTSNNIEIYTKRLEELKAEAAATAQANAALTDNLSKGTQIMTTALGNLAGRFGYEAVRKAADIAVQGMKASVSSAIEYETAMAKVTKTVNASAAEINTLSDSLKGLAAQIPHTAAELAEIAALGGQLGISTSGLLEFTKTMALLGDSTNLTAEQAGELLAKFANVTGTPEADFGRLGSVLVDLGNNTATTEKDILEMAQRLSAAGTAAGLSADQILGISAALSSLGIESEAGASSLSKLVNRFQVATATGKGLVEIAEVAGVTAKEFSDIFGNNAAEALTIFINGLSKSDKQVAVLQDTLGITEVRLTNTLQALASNTDVLTNAVDTASTAWKSNTALTREASIFYDTTAAKVDRAKSAMKSFGSSLGQYVTPLIGGLADAVTGMLSPLDASKTAIDAAGAKLAEYGATAKVTAGSIDSVASAQRALNSVLMLDSIKDMATLWSDASKQQAKYSKEAEGYLYVYQDYIAGILETARSNGLAVNSIDELTAAMERNAKIASYRGRGVDTTDPYQAGTIKQRLEAANKYYEKYNKATLQASAYTEQMGEAVEYVANAYYQGIITNSQLALSGNEKFNESVKATAIYLSEVEAHEREGANTARETLEAAADSAKRLVEESKNTAFGLEFGKETLEREAAELEKLIVTLDTSSDEYKKASVTLAIYKAGIDDITAQLDDTAAKHEEVSKAIDDMTAAQSRGVSTGLDEIDALKANIEALKKERDGYIQNSDAADEYKKKLDELITIQEKNLKVLEESYAGELQDKVSSLQKSFINQYGTEAEKSALKLQELEAQYKSIEDTIKSVQEAGSDGILDKETTDSLVETLEDIKTGLKGVKDSFNDTGTASTWLDTLSTISDAVDEMDATASSFATTFSKAMLEAAESFGSLTEDSGAKGVEKIATFFDGMGSIVSGSLNAAAQYWTAQIDQVEDRSDEVAEKAERATREANQKTEQELAALEQQYSEGAISYGEYLEEKRQAEERNAEALERIEEEKRQAEEETARQKNDLARKAFEANQANQIAAIIMNAATAILKAWADLGPIGAGIATAAITALAGTQTALVAQQKFIPQYAKGGVFDSPHIGIIGEDGAEAVMPLEKNTEWIDTLAQKITRAQGRIENTYSTSNDSHAITVNQEIYARPQSKREIYLQTRAAIATRR